MQFIEVKLSPKHGKGVFASHEIKKGDIILSWDLSIKLTPKEARKLSADEREHTNYIGNGVYVLMQPPEAFVNHSCEPNTFVKNHADVALRDIRKGEEITTDYSINGVDDWTMECHCGKPSCRKIIVGDFRKLPAEIQKKKIPLLEDWYKTEFNIKEQHNL